MPILGNDSSAGKKPTTPVIGTAADGGTGTTVSVSFTPSTYIGKGTITYTALSNPGSISATSSGTPITVSGLTEGTSYTFTVIGNTNYGVASDSSAISNSVIPILPNSYESIATMTASGSSTTVSFTDIPQTYKHLQIRYIAQANFNSNTYSYIRMRFNGDSSSPNYERGDITLYYTGSTWSTIGNTTNNTDSGNAGLVPLFTSGTIPYVGVGIIDIFDYCSTIKNKTTKSISGTGINSSSVASMGQLYSLWKSNSAINRIDLISPSGNLRNYSTFSLYGIKDS